VDALTFAFSAMMILLIRTQGRAAVTPRTRARRGRTLSRSSLRSPRAVAAGGVARRHGQPARGMGAVGDPRTLRRAQRPGGVRPPTSAWSSVPAVCASLAAALIVAAGTAAAQGDHGALLGLGDRLFAMVGLGSRTPCGRRCWWRSSARVRSRS
jgi:hypothetical protein